MMELDAKRDVLMNLIKYLRGLEMKRPEDHEMTKVEMMGMRKAGEDSGNPAEEHKDLERLVDEEGNETDEILEEPNIDMPPEDSEGEKDIFRDDGEPEMDDEEVKRRSDFFNSRRGRGGSRDKKGKAIMADLKMDVIMPKGQRMGKGRK